VFDCAEPDRLAKFWAATLGYRLQDPPQGFASWEEFLVAHGVPEEQWDSRSAIVDPEGRGPRIFFQRVPESKTVKNRLHLDVSASGGPSVPLEERRQRIETVVERVVGLGATRLRAVEEGGDYHVAMQDPEGNEFDIQ
jgi:hypothetical protein